MKRSRLEIYLEILGILNQTSPIKLTHIMCKVNINCGILKEYMNFMLKQGLIEERTAGKRLFYAITQKGIDVLENFQELKQILPVIELTQNRD